MGSRAVAAIALASALLLHASSAVAATRDDAKKAELARDFNDPLTALPQLFLQDAFTPESHGTKAVTNRVTARFIAPRVPRFSLFPLVQLVRPSVSLVTVPTGRGRETRTELGDSQIFDLAVLPWPAPESGAMVGVGGLLVLPTATDERAGQGAWQAGPAFGAIYKGIPGLLAGVLVQNPIAFAYTSYSLPPLRPLHTLLVQPILLMHLWRGLYAKSADATWSFGWHDGSPELVPVSFGLGWVQPRENAPPLNLFVSGEWLVHRHDAPVAPKTTVRVGLTVAIPRLGLDAP